MRLSQMGIPLPLHPRLNLPTEAPTWTGASVLPFAIKNMLTKSEHEDLYLLKKYVLKERCIFKLHSPHVVWY